MTQTGLCDSHSLKKHSVNSILWLKMIIICQLQHTTQWGTSVPHFCHLSHIAMACVMHWQNCKGWEVWLWSWEYECIAGSLFMKRDFEKRGERCCSVGTNKKNESTTYTQVGMNDSRKGHLSRYKSQMVWKHKAMEKAHPVLCCLPCKTWDCRLTKEDVDKLGGVQQQSP